MQSALALGAWKCCPTSRCSGRPSTAADRQGVRRQPTNVTSALKGDSLVAVVEKEAMDQTTAELVRCPSCKQQASATVEVCPNCGHLLNEHKRRHRREGALLLISVGIFIQFFSVPFIDPAARLLKQVSVWVTLAGLLLVSFGIRRWKR